MKNYPDPFTAEEMAEGLSSNYGGAASDPMLAEFGSDDEVSNFTGKKEKTESVVIEFLAKTNTTKVIGLFTGAYPTMNLTSTGANKAIIYNGVSSDLKAKTKMDFVLANSVQVGPLATDLELAWMDTVSGEYVKLKSSVDIEALRKKLASTPRRVLGGRLSYNDKSLESTELFLGKFGPKSQNTTSLETVRDLKQQDQTAVDFDDIFVLGPDQILYIVLPQTPAGLGANPSEVRLSLDFGVGYSAESALIKKTKKTGVKKPAVKK